MSNLWLFLVANKRLYIRVCPSSIHQRPCSTFATDAAVYTALFSQWPYGNTLPIHPSVSNTIVRYKRGWRDVTWRHAVDVTWLTWRDVTWLGWRDVGDVTWLHAVDVTWVTWRDVTRLIWKEGFPFSYLLIFRSFVESNEEEEVDQPCLKPDDECYEPGCCQRRGCCEEYRYGYGYVVATVTQMGRWRWRPFQRAF